MVAKKATAKAAAPTASDFKLGDIVLTKVKGYPEWPGKVCRVLQVSVIRLSPLAECCFVFVSAAAAVRPHFGGKPDRRRFHFP